MTEHYEIYDINLRELTTEITQEVHEFLTDKINEAIPLSDRKNDVMVEVILLYLASVCKWSKMNREEFMKKAIDTINNYLDSVSFKDDSCS